MYGTFHKRWLKRLFKDLVQFNHKRALFQKCLKHMKLPSKLFAGISVYELPSNMKTMIQWFYGKFHERLLKGLFTGLVKISHKLALVQTDGFYFNYSNHILIKYCGFFLIFKFRYHFLFFSFSIILAIFLSSMVDFFLTFVISM